MATAVETWSFKVGLGDRVSETGGNTSKTRSDRLPAQPVVFFCVDVWEMGMPVM